MKYYYYTYTVYRDDSQIKGMGTTNAIGVFPLIRIMNFLSSDYNAKYPDIRISFWGEISESDYDQWNEIADVNRKKK